METVGSNRTSKGDFRKNLARNAALSMLNNNMRQGDSLNANMGTGELAGAVRSSALLAEAKVVRESIGFKRSDKLLRLFDFLIDRTLADRPPAEIEIANEVFSIGRDVDVPQDATVRVYVHRLRKALDQIYADRPGPRLSIPKGEYRVVLVEERPDPIAPPAAVTADAALPQRRWWLVAAVLVVLALVNLGIWWSVRAYRAPASTSSLARTYLWRPIAFSHRPITLVLGDYYLFAEAPGAVPPGAPVPSPRLVRNPSINAREDLDIYLMAHPDQIGRAIDMDLRYVPSGAVLALGDLYAALRQLRGDPATRVTLIAASQLTPDILKTSDVVYVGQLSGFGTLLRNPLFQASGFRIGQSWDELIDTASGRRFRSDGGIVQADEQIARRDYGYIASLPGPSGNHIVVIAGTRDPALLQMAELAVDAGRLKALNHRAAINSGGFEALYQVRTMGNLNLSGTLLLQRPLRFGGIWDKPDASQRFPDDTYEGAGHARP
ncbi:hypothetical protein SUS17_2420 [Sphingomonas sp. S17]|nr:hypothetical protein SUS17_2420 [Sphingomonas sp. S17]MDG5970244.1 winged helix-turn-helix domain-containing protein [Sphingomonas paucimobilis]SUJ33860.1 Uncharacterised protein [Sphingomonas paucimobilis]